LFQGRDTCGYGHRAKSDLPSRRRKRGYINGIKQDTYIIISGTDYQVKLNKY
jgi:hypothetical protein